MKIGILTFHRAYNYGALFQAYGLRKYLIERGNDVDFVDYWPLYHQEEYKLFSLQKFFKLSFLGKLKFLLSFIIGFTRVTKRRKGYLSFMKNYLNLDNKIFEYDKSFFSSFDLIICGSDQIWRKHNYSDFKGFDPVYFGEFENSNIISYAASMGIITLKDEDETFLKSSLANFKAISVREYDLQERLDKIGFKTKVVLDPVFLLSKENWEAIASKSAVKKEKYIFFYHHMESEDAKELVFKLQQKYNLKVKIIRPVVYPTLFGEKYAQTASPSEFLNLIKNAEFVVSTSFHGVALSIVFEKQFYALGMGDNSGRVKSLLHSLNIGNRYIQNLYEIENDIDNIIDYKVVSLTLQNLIVESKSWLDFNVDKFSVDGKN